MTTISDGACMEGEAKEAISAIPGMASKGKMGPYVLIISDNSTKLSGRIEDQTFSMQPYFKSLTSLGWEVIELKQGNDLKNSYHSLQQAIAKAKSNPQKPVAIIAKTVKGYGVEKTVNSPNGGHGFPLKTPSELTEFLAEIYQGEEVPLEFKNWQTEMENQAALKPQNRL